MGRGVRVEGDGHERPLPPDPYAPMFEPEPDPELVTRPLSAVQPERVTWLWQGRIADGKLAALGGNPGIGKSYVTLALAAAVSTGVDLAAVDVPDDRRRTDPADVLIASFEDEAADTLRPRAELLGADIDRVHEIIGTPNGDGGVTPFGVADVGRLERRLAKLSRPRLVVIDPVGSWVGAGVDVYRDNEVRAALDGLRLVAAQYRVAVLLVMHLRKAAASTALARFSGSGAFGQLVRSALLAGQHPDDEHLAAIAHVKHNLAAQQPTVGYRIDDAGLTWTGTVADLDGERLVGHDRGEDRTERADAQEWLVGLLTDRGGAMPRAEIVKLSRAEGFAESTLKRARVKAGIVADRLPEFKSSTVWRLPSVTPAAATRLTDRLSAHSAGGVAECAE